MKYRQQAEQGSEESQKHGQRKSMLGCKRAHTESKQGNQVKQTGQTN